MWTDCSQSAVWADTSWHGAQVSPSPSTVSARADTPLPSNTTQTTNSVQDASEIFDPRAFTVAQCTAHFPPNSTLLHTSPHTVTSQFRVSAVQTRAHKRRGER